MKKLFEILENMTPSFIDGLNQHLFVYMTIGSGTSESPMWIQMGSVDRDNNTLRFSNSQKTGIGFNLPIDEDSQDLISDYRDETYDYFKYKKYFHIKNNYPSVWEELTKGNNGIRINSFMDSYENTISN